MQFRYWLMAVLGVVLIIGMTLGIFDSKDTNSESSAPPSCLAPVTPTPPTKTNNIYFVAKNGSDSNPGTETQPWLTIQKAADTLTAGETVFVKSGTYNEQVRPPNSGNNGRWITYKAVSGDTVTIDGTSLNNQTTGLFDINGKSYIWVEGLKISNSKYDGLSISGESNYVTLNSLTINGTQRSGIHAAYQGIDALDKISNLTIDRCEIYNTNKSGDQEAISLVSIKYFEVKNCLVYDVKAGKEGIDAKVGCNNGSIHDNEVYNAKQGIYIDAAAAATSNISIYNNRLSNNSVAGIMLGSEGFNKPMTNVNIYNNLIYSNAVGLRVSGDAFNKSFNLINNTFYHNGVQEIQISDPGQYQQNCYISNNIIIGRSATTNLFNYRAYPAGVTLDHNLFYPGSSSSVDNKYGTNYILSKDPLLVNPGRGNFALQRISPAVDAGSAIRAPAFDFVGISRPQGAGYDIGAYEFSPGVPE
jgi:hypothetical protein